LDGGQEIGEGFPDAGARFDEQMMSRGERLFHRRRHLKLLRPMLVAFAHAAGDGAVGAEDVQEHRGHTSSVEAAGQYTLTPAELPGVFAEIVEAVKRRRPARSAHGPATRRSIGRPTDPN